MSGALSSLASAAGGSLVSSVLGLTQTAAWRGVIFDVLDSRHSAGRRWAQFLFPGRPDTIQEDLGAVDGPIEIQGLIIGDDWLRRQKRFEAACKQAGPGTLRHPWLGELKCALSQPAEFSFDHQQQLMCTVTLHFQVWQERKVAPSTTLGGLLDAIDGAIGQAQLFLAGVLAPLGDAVALLGLAQSVLGRVAGVWDGLLGSSPAGIGTDSTGALAAAAAAPLDALTGGVALVGDATLALQLAGLTEATPAALSLAVDVAADPAIGPGPLAPPPTPAADPRVAAAVMLAALPQLQPMPGELPLSAAMLQSARVQAVVEAARAASGAVWDSRDEALLWRDKIDTALGQVQGELAAAAAGPAWRALRDVRTAWARDMNEAIGRLPPVQHLVTFAPMSAWLIALAIAGDGPAGIRPAMLDFVSRNRIRHPGWVAPSRYEVVGSNLTITPMLQTVVAASLSIPILPTAGDADVVSIAGSPLSIGGSDLSIGGLAPQVSSGAASTAGAVSIAGQTLSIAGDDITIGGT